MKKVIYFNQILLAGNRENYTVEEKIKYAGLNTGNIVYVEALKQELNIEKELWFGDAEIENFNQNEYVGVLPCANMIGMHDTCTERWNEMIRQVSFPVVLIGMGAQSTRELDTPSKLVHALPTEKKYALQEMCERVKSIGIRGNFTAECLELLGIKNYRVIGCPSLYLNMKKEWKEIKPASSERCVMNLNPDTILGSQIMNLGFRYDAKWIMQVLNEMPKTVYESCSITEGHLKKHFPKCEIEVNKLEDFMRKNAFMFFELSDWDDFIRSNDFTFSYGSRFHGNVVSIRNGVPALWVTHDSRTQELIDTFELPFTTAKNFAEITDIEQLIEQCDYSKFYKKYKEMYIKYVEFLTENNISYKN